ncbi:MAG: hypothetical protein ACTSPY_12935 [Candidatus Helarchaeota archaeon]
MAKEKKEKKIEKKFGWNLVVLISTILIIILSTFSVFSAFFIFSVQSNVKHYNQEYSSRYSVLAILEKDIDKILSDEEQRQQISLITQQDLINLNQEIKNMKIYNATHPGTYNKTDIDIKALEFISIMKTLNFLMRNSLAYNWSIENMALHENNYTFNGTEYYLIINRYNKIKPDLDPDLINLINSTLNESEREILEIDLANWEGEMFNDLNIVQEFGEYTNIYTSSTDIFVSGFSYYDILNEADTYLLISETYQQSVSIMSTALVLLTVASVIVTFIVSIDDKLFIWTSLIIGIIVLIIGFWMFFLSFGYLTRANVMVVWW